MKKFILIISLFFGVVVAEDLDPKKLEISCDNGDMDACYNLGVLYDDGNGVKQNYQKAAKLYQKSCDNNHILSCAALGRLYIYLAME
ncbi:tetratricopeptide repeat protein [Campylobacter porcelli]|uniref:beta-lactamase n=1 Tax=Campylobacter porcelli TaxID=1660073 RepID=A0ABU7M6I6_9BACT|nr:tetratricopeptide repeat protein [Campylobacter sp. CX2-4855-23]MEE3777438.1 tetratricopeptide repeat protein [Campylobacter sp. CX2-4080-23]